MIHAASRQALVELRERVAQATSQSDASAAADQQNLAEQIYSVSELLAAQPRLRRTLADPSTDASSRGDLARSLLSGKISDPAIDVVVDAVTLRWSNAWDLADALEIAADDVLLAAAQSQGELDEVEDELFRFERILAGSGELTAALDEGIVAADRRAELVDSVLSGKVRPITMTLVRHAVISSRKRSIQSAIDDLLEASAARRERSVARVLSAAELTDEQTRRLASALTRIYGRQISVRSAVDPSVRGGLVVRVADEVIDASVAARLTAARIALAG